MMEALRNSRMGMRALFVLAAMMVALMAASVMLNAPTGSLGSSLGTKEADAMHTGTAAIISGRVFTSSGSYAPYADVTTYKWSGSSWVEGQSKRADAYGRYSFSVGREHYYYVRASKPYGNCITNGRVDLYNGNTNTLTVYSSTSSVVANVTIYYRTSYYC